MLLIFCMLKLVKERKTIVSLILMIVNSLILIIDRIENYAKI